MPKRKFMVMKRSKDPVNINTGRGRRKTWRENGGKADFFYVSSESEAKEIDEVYGNKGTQEVWVKEHGQAGHDATYKMDSGKYSSIHNYFFGGITVDLKDAIPLEEDPNWEEYSPGRWRRKERKRGTRRKSAEVTDGSKEKIKNL